MNLWAWLRLLRLTNSLPATGLVLLGAYIADGWPPPRATWLAAGAMWAITSFGYVTNDLYDVATDRINKPDRPIPSGRVGWRSACVLAVILALLAMILASLIDAFALGVACFVMAALIGYNAWLKRTVLIGNVTIAALSGAALAVGGYTVRVLWPLLWPGVLVSLFILAREVLKTIEDVPGDRRVGMHTIATVWGPRWAGYVFAGIVGGYVIITLLAYWMAGFSSLYLALAAVIDIGWLYSALIVVRAPTPHNARKGLRISKVGYGLGLLALLLA